MSDTETDRISNGIAADCEGRRTGKPCDKFNPFTDMYRTGFCFDCYWDEDAHND